MSELPPLEAKDTPLAQGLSIFELQGFHASAGIGAYPFQTALDGRLLSEGKASNVAIQHSISRGHGPRERPSKLTTYRHGHPENFAAFDAIAKRWPTPLDALAWINYEYFGENVPSSIALIDLKNMAELGIYASSFLLNKANGYAPTDNLPNVVADVLKICQGIFTAAVTLESSYTEQLEPTALTNAIDKEQLLLAIDGSVCPAPLPMIHQALFALMDRKGTFATSEMRTILVDEDFNKLQRYIAYHEAYATVATQLGDEISQIMKGIHQIDTAQQLDFFTIRIIPYTETLQRYAAKIQAIQNGINEVLGRDPTTAPPVTEDSLAQFESLTFTDLISQ